MASKPLALPAISRTTDPLLTTAFAICPTYIVSTKLVESFRKGTSPNLDVVSNPYCFLNSAIDGI